MSWLSKQLEKSKRNQTGFYSWDDAVAGLIPDEGGVGFMGFDFDWGGGKSKVKLDLGGTPPEMQYLKYGFMALGAWVIIKLASR